MDYDLLIAQTEALANGEKNTIGLYANVASLIREASGWHWVGFYFVHGDELWLGPFQGPLACSRIAFGKGVCGTAWAERLTMVVPDVNLFAGHIACSSLSRSEIVVPVFTGDKVSAVLDIDSAELNAFSPTDRLGLEQICAILGRNNPIIMPV